jgi:CheY-like chemotaxis protein
MTGSQATIRILFAEDTKATRRLFAAACDGAKYSVDMAVNGQEAVDKFKRCGYDVVLTDLQMPVLDGIGAAKQMRTIEADEMSQRRTPIIALTASESQDTGERCRQAGIDTCLYKPIDFRELFRTIRRVLGD